MINLTKKGIKTTSFYALLAILMWITFLSIHIWSFGFTDHSQPSDCVIVLGASVSEKSSSPVFKERIEHAISLYQQGIISKIALQKMRG